MRIPIDINSCFRADEIRRIGLAIKYANMRDYYRKALLDEMDRELPDYDRPTESIKAKRNWKGIPIIKLIKSLLP